MKNQNSGLVGFIGLERQAGIDATDPTAQRSPLWLEGKTSSAQIAGRLTAEARLKHTDWAIAEISYSLGFEEPAHVSKPLRKHAQVTPAAWQGECVVKDRLEGSYTNLQWAGCNKQAGKAVLAILAAEGIPCNRRETGICRRQIGLATCGDGVCAHAFPSLPVGGDANGSLSTPTFIACFEHIWSQTKANWIEHAFPAETLRTAVKNCAQCSGCMEKRNSILWKGASPPLTSCW